MVFLASDNTSGISDAILQAMQAANHGDAKSYGGDEWTARLTLRCRELFAHPDLLVFPVFNGSAANCLALAGIVRAHEAIIAHEFSHIEQDECGMPEFFTGAKLLTAGGANGKLEPALAARLIELAISGGVHHSRPRVISITQSSELGTVYQPQEIAALSALARERQLLLHMDGARFANAVAQLGCHPADISWKAGVDILSFGGTKNGAMIAEAVIFFNPALAGDFGHMRKRAGQLASKQRFIAAQLLALLEKGLWLENAGHANAMAERLAAGLRALSLAPMYPREANALFVRLPKKLAEGLFAKGHYFYGWPLLGEDVYRLLTSFATQPGDIDAFLADVKTQIFALQNDA
jgi:threonine aldolase